MPLSRKSHEASIKQFAAQQKKLASSSTDISFADELRKEIAISNPVKSGNTDSNAQKVGHVLAGIGRGSGRAVRAVARPVLAVASGDGGKAVNDAAQLGSNVTGGTGNYLLNAAIANPAKELAAEISNNKEALKNANRKSNENLGLGEKGTDIGNASKKWAGNAANAGLSFVGGGAAKGIVTGGAKNLIVKGAKAVALGAGLGASGTLAQDPGASAKDIAKSAAIGGVIGGTLPVVGVVAKKAGQRISETISLKAIQASSKAGVVVDKTILEPVGKIAAPHQVTGKVTKDPVVKEFLSGLSRSNRVSGSEQNLAAATINQQAKKLGVKADVDFMDRLMSGKLTNTKEVKLGEFIKNYTDDTFSLQKTLHPEIQYRSNYLPGAYEGTAEAKEQALNQLRKTTGNDKAKFFQNYAEAADISGLKPKYTDAGSLVATNRGEAIKAIENQKVIKTAIEKGLLLPEGSMKRVAPKDWIEVNGISGGNGKRLFAQKEVADTINNTLQEGGDNISKGLRIGREVSGGLQQMVLSGGVPGTPLNMYVGGQVMKDLLGAGRGSVLKDIVYGSSKQLTQKRFIKKTDFIRKITSAGGMIGDIETSLSTDSNKYKNAWHALIDRPTFERFVPNTKLTVAENTYKKLMRKGVGEKEAIRIAAETINIFNGAVDVLAKGRSKNAQNALGTVFFAPKFREGIIGTLVNSVKAWAPKNIKDPSYAMSRRLAVGTVATALLYDQVNRQINGHGMLQNPEGKQFTLQIPYGGEKEKVSASGRVTKYRSTVNIPLFPSYLTLPRAAVGAILSALKGDVKGVAGEAGKTFSTPIQYASQVIANKDYFGKEIVNPEDSSSDKLKSQGAYAAGQLSPGWVRAGIGKLRGQSNEEVGATALELPVRFGKLSPMSDRNASFAPSQITSDFYKAYNPLSANKKKTLDEIRVLLPQDGRPGEPQKAARLAQEYNQSIQSKLTPYYKKYGQNPGQEQYWEDMVNGLRIDMGDKAVNARQKSYNKSHKMVN